MYICIYIYTYVHIHIHTYMLIYMYTHTYTYTHIYSYIVERAVPKKFSIVFVCRNCTYKPFFAHYLEFPASGSICACRHA